MKFVHLHVHSHYSLLDGLAKIDELVDYAKEIGYESLALTDHGSMYGIPEFYQKCKKTGIKPILGVECYFAPGGRFQKRANIDNKRYHITLLAKNNEGYQNLLKIVTKSNLEGFYYKPRIDKELLEEYSNGIICLSGCLNGEISQLVLKNQLEKAEKKLEEYLEIFKDDLYIELNYHPNIPESLVAKNRLIDLSKKYNVPVVATYDTHYLKPEDRDAHDVLLAIQTKNKINDENRLTMKNEDFSLCSKETMEELYLDIPEAISNSQKIADKCNVELDVSGKNFVFPQFQLPENFKDNIQYFEHLCKKGLEERLGNNISDEIRERFDYEIEMIKKMGFVDYFLIVQDFINWARQRNIFVGQGRGSAAGSLIAFVLKITDVNPIKYELIFERFLNPERISMPDIDIDFSDTRRDEVSHYLQEKYGKEHVAQIITFGTMKAKAVIRDAGRAMGLSYIFCDSIAKLIPLGEFGRTLEISLHSVEELKRIYKGDEQAKKLIDYAKKLEGVVRHASTHPCGTVITRESLINYVPLQKAPQSEEIIITQYDMHGIEDLGLLKMDLLGIRTLTIIENTLEIIEAIHNKKIEIEIEKIPIDDEKTFKLFRKTDTVGVFQLEGTGIRRYLKDLIPNNIEDIIVILALYRPGPLKTGMVREFIERKHGRKQVKYIHPKLEPILNKTYGILVYQEQLLRIAKDLAGFTMGEADILRKAVGKKIKKLLKEQKDKLIKGMIDNDISEDIAKKIWEFIEPFAQYGFNRSHSVSYALISYQTAYLKANYPLEFMAAMMNNEAKEVERTAELISECNRMGIKILLPDINESLKKFTVLKDKNSIRFGLQAIKNVGENISKEIVEERKKNGKYIDIKDFLERVGHKDLNKKSLESLIRAGTFDNMAERGELFENIDELLRYNQDNKKSEQSSQATLFDKEMIFSPLNIKKIEPISVKEKLNWEREFLGLYISDHPLNHIKKKIENIPLFPISKIEEKIIGKKIRICGIVNSIKKIITKNGKAMLIVKLEDVNNSIEVVVFPITFEKTFTDWKKDNILIIEGRVDKNNGELKVICENTRAIE
jgi:DNA polymerase-3 subunit alpha